MSKTLDIIDIQPTESFPEPNLAEPSTELESEFESNAVEPTEGSSRTPLSFPCTRVEAGKALGVSDVTIGKWIKKICEVGVEVLEGDRISADGFTVLNDYQQAKDKAAFLESLEPVPVEVLPPEGTSSALAIRKESTLAVQNCSSEVYAATAAEYAALDDIEAQMAQELEAMYAEFNELDDALETSREQEEAIGNRRAAMRGMRRAMGEANTEKKQYVSVTNGLRNQQAGKDGGFRQSS